MAAKEEPYPTQTRCVAVSVDDVLTEILVRFFVDKIMITVAQAGRLPVWTQVPLLNKAPEPMQDFNYTDDETGNEADGMSLLPTPRLSASTLMGGGNEERQTVAQVFAIRIGHYLLKKNTNEGRTLVLGLGLTREVVKPTEYDQLMDAIIALL